MKDIQPNIEYCFRCEEAIQKEQLHGEQHLAGEICVNLIGGYNSFHDNNLDEEMFALMICHDCAAELYRFLNLDPNEFEQVQALHPDYTNNPVGKAMCCEYAWRATDDDEDGVELGIKYQYDNIMKGTHQ